jgi:hypothetical protein
MLEMLLCHGSAKWDAKFSRGPVPGYAIASLQNPQKPKGPGDLQNMKKNYFNSPQRSKTINKKKFSFLNP